MWHKLDTVADRVEVDGMSLHELDRGSRRTQSREASALIMFFAELQASRGTHEVQVVHLLPPRDMTARPFKVGSSKPRQN